MPHAQAGRDLIVIANQDSFENCNINQREGTTPNLSLSNLQPLDFSTPSTLSTLLNNELKNKLQAYYKHKDFASIHLPIFDDPQPIEDSYVNLTMVQTNDYSPIEKNLLQTTQPDDYGNSVYELKTSVQLPELFALNHEGKPERPRSIITGRAGIGKSTFCRYVAYHWSLPDPLWSYFDLLLWVPLRRLAAIIDNKEKKQSLTNITPFILAELLIETLIEESTYVSGLKLSQAKALTNVLEGDSCQHILLLADGFDEIKQTLAVSPALRQVWEAILRQPYFLMTTRPHALEKEQLNRYIDDNSHYYELLGFLNKDIPDYITKTFRLLGREDSQRIEFLEFLQANRTVWGIAHVPLCLALLCYVWEPDFAAGTLLNFTALYQLITDKLWDIFLSRHSGLNQQTLAEIDYEPNGRTQLLTPLVTFLERLAFQGLQSEQLIFDGPSFQHFSQTNRTLLETFQTYLQSWKNSQHSHTQSSLLRLIEPVRHTGFMKAFHEQQSSQPTKPLLNAYFIHLTFQEYFAAHHWVNQFIHSEPKHTVSLDFLNKTGGNPRYEMFWVFVAGLLKIKKIALHSLAPKLQDYLHTLSQPILNCTNLRQLTDEPKLVHRLLMILRTYEEIQATLPKPLQQWLFDFIDEICLYRNIHERQPYLHKTLHYLKQCPYQLDKLAIKDYLKIKANDFEAKQGDDFRGAKQYAIQARFALQLLSSEDDLDNTLQFMMTSANAPSHQRIEAIHQWVTLGDAAAFKQPYVDVLLTVLKEDTLEVSLACLKALLSLAYVDHEESILAELSQYHQTSEHVDLKPQIQQTLNQLKALAPSYQCLEQIQRACDKDKPTKAAEHINKLQQFKLWHIKDFVDVLQQAIVSPYPNVACSALNTLTVLFKSHCKAISSLLYAAILAKLSDEDNEVRRAATNTLKQLGLYSQDLTTTLYQALLAEDENVWQTAADVLQARSLHQTTSDEGNLSTSTTLIEILLSLLDASNPNQTVLKALSLLEKIPHFDPKYAQPFDVLLQQADFDIFQSVIHTLLTLGETHPAWLNYLNTMTIQDRLLAELVSACQYRRRINVIDMLGRLNFKNQAVKQALYKALISTERDEVRHHSAQTLCKLGLNDETLKQALLHCLSDDKNSNTREHAAEALAELQFKDDDVIYTLAQAFASDETYKVRQTATQILKTMDAWKPSFETIHQLRADHSSQRLRAIQTLINQTLQTPIVQQGLLFSLQHDDNITVRQQAARALGELQFKNDVVKQALFNSLASDNDYEVRLAATMALGQPVVHHPSFIIVPEFLIALKDYNHRVRQSAAQALTQYAKHNKDSVIPALLNALNDNDSWRVRQSAAHALAQCAQHHKDSVIPALLNALNDNDSWRVRQSAAHALAQCAQHHKDSVIPALLNALNDNDSDVRQSAAQALAQCHKHLSGYLETVIPALLNALNDNDSWRVRQSAAHALAQCHEHFSGHLETVIPALLNALNDYVSSVRQSAAHALAQCAQHHKDSVIPALLNALNDNDSWRVRQSAAHALAQCAQHHKDSVIPALLNALNDNDSWRVRQSAAHALAQCHKHLSGYLETVIPALLNALNDNDSYVRQSAAHALAQCHEHLSGHLETVIPTLLNALKEDKSTLSWRVRQSAAHALAQCHEHLSGHLETVIPALLNALNDNDSDVRQSAAHALAQCAQHHKDSVIPALLNALNDNDSWRVRQSAAQALAQCYEHLSGHFETVIPTLLNALNDDVSWRVRQSAAQALVQCHEHLSDYLETVIPALLNALNDNDSWCVGQSAAKTLGHCHKHLSGYLETVIPTLLKALNDNDSDVRQSAAHALAQCAQHNKDSVIPALLNALNDNDSWRVRQSAAQALAQCYEHLSGHFETVIPTLLNALNDDVSWRVRQSAAQALVQCHEHLSGHLETVIPALLNALNDNDSDVRQSAVQALAQSAQHDKDSVIPALLNALKEDKSTSSWRVRLAATQALQTLGSDKTLQSWIKNIFTTNLESKKTFEQQPNPDNAALYSSNIAQPASRSPSAELPTRYDVSQNKSEEGENHERNYSNNEI